MLDKTTKTKIDTARDILVGKVPNPQSQVELITIAMIYKFMDDMDMQNIELGGNRIFFTDDLEQYAWSKVLSKSLNNWERISLYAEALDKLQVAKQIPELFRKIFKGAFLPFRDGATLTLFLNEIDGFSYNNSENLGNAFEYLLSIMGSQGDAGQFRTPRHIIDFIVDVVNPSKRDTILDPACGTAGFLISAYKHIIERAKEQEKDLNPEQHQQLMKNIVGYDISPDMVKLASVNLFLHQFPQPKIYEYDTLSDDTRWNDKFDVILANPPFMTPKGGIMPHSKFGVKANRAEVLFVDYMMEHLNLKGKAGFVVPEGIIFQSATAYKALRKMMVEDNYLYAVVSLPSGVFNPYSGVKTSVLFFDRELAKQTQDILFVRVDKDGYDLGAQRRPIKDNDLPEVIRLLQLWQKSVTSGTIAEELSKSQRVTIVSKEKIAEDGEFNLTASRYQKAEDFSNCQYEMVKLGDVAEIKRGQAISKKDTKEGNIPVIAGGQQPAYYHNENNRTGEQITVAGSGAYAGFINYYDTPIFVSDAFTISSKDTNTILNKFIYRILKSKQNEIYSLKAGAGIPHVYPKDFVNMEIPLPPMSVQEDIVKELDAYQAIIDGAQKVVDNWKPTFTINPNWEKVKIGDVCDIARGGSPRPIEKFITDDLNGINWIKIGDAEERSKYITKTKEKIIPEGMNKSRFVKEGDFILSNSMSFGRPYIMKTSGCIHDGWLLLRQKDQNLMKDYLYYILSSDFVYRQFSETATGGVVNNLNSQIVSNTTIFLPSLEEQKAIVAQIEQEEQYVDACKKLIELNKKKIADKIKSIWNCDDE